MYVKCLQLLAGTIKPFSGEHIHFVYVIPRRLAFRFVTSIVLGIAYGRRILDLKDEMVSFNYKSALGKCIGTLLGQA